MLNKYGCKLWLHDGSYAIMLYANFKFEIFDKENEYILCTPKEFLDLLYINTTAIVTAYCNYVEGMASRIKWPEIPFSECFRRVPDTVKSGTVRYLFRYNKSPVDIFKITGIYLFPTEYQGGPFCSSYTTFDIADGQMTSVVGYGWGNQSYKLVVGQYAVRALCLFFGIQQPRYIAECKKELNDAEILTLLTNKCQVEPENPVTYTNNLSRQSLN